MPPLVTISLVAVNVAVLFLLLTAPLGVRTISVRRVVKARRADLWEALWPLGSKAGWSGEILSASVLESQDEAVLACLRIGWEGRDGQPIERVVRFEEVAEGQGFAMQVVDDTSLDPVFWQFYRERTALAGEDGAVAVTLTRTDRYRGAAFLVFRYFAMRRELSKLKRWAETGKYRRGGIFEHPLTQAGFAVLSILIFWPFFGLTTGGLALSAILTLVVGLHELGHMAAFRLMGHRRVRMIFVPLLGGIAIGGRPYDSRFEVAFVALMGAGFSAFLVPVAIAFSDYAHMSGLRLAGALCAILAGFLALFNIANLVPVWKFDGGQVLRQICSGKVASAVASFAMLSALLGLGYLAGFPSAALAVAGGVFAVLGLMTAGSGVKPRKELKPIGTMERIAIAAALVAVCAVHGYGLLWAAAKLV